MGLAPQWRRVLPPRPLLLRDATGRARPEPRGTPVKTAARQRPGSCPFSGVMMGSKMASASRVVQVVKPHTPLIRFPDRRDNPKPNVSEVLRSAGLPSHTSSISQHSKGSKSPDWLMHQGPPDTAEMIRTLPQKYRRKLVSQEEMEFIQVCCCSLS